MKFAPRKLTKAFRSSLLILAFFTFILSSCHLFDQSLFETDIIEIRSCPGGGGIFIIKVLVSGDQIRELSLDLECDDMLNATLHIPESGSGDALEIVIEPDSNIAITDQPILLRGSLAERRDSLLLNVHMINWTDTKELGDLIIVKMNNYIDWLHVNHPAVEIYDTTQWELFATYPQTIIVDYFTLLNDQYELRVCNHAMIPPEDWSAIRLRERCVYQPFLTLRQDSTNGAIYEIHRDEFPTLFDY